MTPSLLEAGPKAVAGLDELVEHLDEVVFRLDADGCWTFLNAAWERRLGWARRECLGRSAVPFIHRRDRAALRHLWTEAVTGDQPAHRGEVRMRDAHGGARWMLLSARRCDDAAGRFAGVTGTMTDISREKAAEATLARACAAAETAGRAKSEFLSAMGHELRTPLNAVIGLSESLLEASAAADPERARRYLGLIHASGRQLLTQVNDLVDLARIEAGQVRPLLVAVDLGAMVALAAEGQQRDARTRGIELVVTPPASPVTATVDERLMRRVFQALIANAVKVTRPKGRVDVAVRTGAAGRVEFTVCDAGSGLLTDLQSPRQATTAGTNVRQLNGTDLVLALADRVARLHGGILTVESIAGQGSAVAIDLPAAGSAPAANTISP